MTDDDALIWEDAQKIKSALAFDPRRNVQMSCFNEDEVNKIKKHLSEDEIARTKFTWLTWPSR